MVYKVVSVLCDNISQGYSVTYAELQNQNGVWNFENLIKSSFEYSTEWKQELSNLTSLPVTEFIDKHNKFGQYLSAVIKNFIASNSLDFKVQLITLKGFDVIESIELGNAAQIAASTGINVVADIRGIPVALNGNGKYEDSVASSLFTEPELQLSLLGVLRWREENNFLSKNTGAKRNSIGGAVWLGQEA